MSDTQPETPRTDPDKHQEKALEDTFPASDPPATTGTTGPAGDRKPEERGD